jgi:hypothetical protein
MKIVNNTFICFGLTFSHNHILSNDVGSLLLSIELLKNVKFLSKERIDLLLKADSYAFIRIANTQAHGNQSLKAMIRQLSIPDSCLFE